MRQEDGEDVIRVYGPYGPYRGKDELREHWRISVRVRNRQSGEIGTRTVRAFSAAEAEDLKKETEALVNADAAQAEIATPTIGAARAAWREWQQSLKTLTPNRRASISGDERRLRLMLPPDSLPLSPRTIARITRSYMDYGAAGTRKPRTVKSVRNILKRFGALLVQKRMLPKNPWIDLPRIEPPAGTPERARLVVDEALVLWRECRRLVVARSVRPYWTGALHVAMVLCTGMRVGDLQDAEVRGLGWWQGRPMLQLFRGKTSAAARKIDLGDCPWLAEALQELAAGRAPTDCLFCTGLPVKESQLSEGTYKAAARRTGVGWRKVRSLRATPPEQQRRPYKEGASVGCVIRRLCRQLKITVVGPHGLRRTNTDLRDLLAERVLADAVAEQDRRSLGHTPGSKTMERVYLSPERKMKRDMYGTCAVIQFLEQETAGTAASEGAKVGDVGPEQGAADNSFRDLLERLGPERLRRMLDSALVEK